MPKLAHHGMAHYRSGMTVRMPGYMQSIAGQAASAQAAASHVMDDLLEDEDLGDHQKEALQDSSRGMRLFLGRCVSL